MNNFNYLNSNEITAGMIAYFLVTYPDGTYEIEKDHEIDEVIDGDKMTKQDFEELKELSETYNDQFQDFEIDDYKGHTICLVNHHIYLYDEDIIKNGTSYRLLVPESERWKSSKKLKDINNKTGIYEMKYLKFFKDLS